MACSCLAAVKLSFVFERGSCSDNAKRAVIIPLAVGSSPLRKLRCESYRIDPLATDFGDMGAIAISRDELLKNLSVWGCTARGMLHALNGGCKGCVGSFFSSFSSYSWSSHMIVYFLFSEPIFIHVKRIHLDFQYNFTQLAEQLVEWTVCRERRDVAAREAIPCQPHMIFSCSVLKYSSALLAIHMQIMLADWWLLRFRLNP